MHWQDWAGIAVPFLGTALGASSVFFMRRTLRKTLRQALSGFASGVMVAASIWSLLLPALGQSAGMGRLAFLPPAIGFGCGVAVLLVLDDAVARLCLRANRTSLAHGRLRQTAMLVLAVTLHNIPEGMAVGVIYAGRLSGVAQITAGSAFAFALGIAIQNYPEGAIISMPLHAEGSGKGSAFCGGVLSGVVEPIAALLTICAAGVLVRVMPYLLSFAAGAMLYVVVEELIPGTPQEDRTRAGVILFAVGFLLMMALDVALG